MDTTALTTDQTLSLDHPGFPHQITFRFGTGAGGNAYLGAGWADPERGYVWSLGLESEMSLPIGGAGVLRLDLLAHLADEHRPFQQLAVIVDGCEVGNFCLAQPRQAVTVDLPPTEAVYRTVILRHPGAMAPQAYSETTDDRKLAVALVRVVAHMTQQGWERTGNETLVPPVSLLIDGADTADSFRRNGEGFARVYLLERGRLRPDERVLDIGSGNGQKARVLTRHLSSHGSYEGLDIVPSAVNWCKERYAPFTNFNFQLADINSSHYNPAGKFDSETYTLPYCDGEFDLVFLCSVFTHMMPAGVTNYSHEIARVLKPGGRCVVTYFLLNDDNLKRMVTGKPVFNFSHPFQGCRVLDAANPTQAVALPEAWVREAWRSAGMRVAEMTFGFWPGAPDVLGALQDMVIVVKPGSA